MQMKKFYSMLLTAAVALSASAGDVVPVKTTGAIEEMRAFAEFKKATSQRAEGTTGVFLSSLNGQIANFNWVYKQVQMDQNNKPVTDASGAYVYDDYPSSTVVTFSEENDEGDGLFSYTMTSPFAGFFTDAIGCPALQVGYFPEDGTFYIPASQVWGTYAQDNSEYNIWFNTSGNSFTRFNPWFTFANGQWTIDNPASVWYEGDEEPTSISFIGSALGRVENNALDVLFRMGKDFSIVPLAGSGNMAWNMNQNGTVKPMTASVGVTLNGTTATITNFAGMLDVPMTVDKAAKTLTANKVRVSSITKYKAYLSEQAADGSNAAGSGKYILTSTYTVAEGKTTINVPNWNAFFSQFGVSGESSYFWPMTDTKIVLDFDLDAKVEDSGIEGVAADAAIVDGPAKFYNLQGVEVANPAAGQVVIKVQGSKATKMVVR